MMRVIISGGGTGGHVFPAIAIANALKALVKDVDILFIGAIGKMEMEKVPAAGYPIEGLPVSGFQRRLTWKNFTFPFRLMASLWKARAIISKFKPDVVIGVGGYASGPALRIAAARGIPTLIQEQNSFPGVTNRILGQKVDKICVAFEGMDQFFPAAKVIFTGNPIRQNLKQKSDNRIEAYRHFGLNPVKKTLLVVGGSLGARTINEAILSFELSLEKKEAPPTRNIQILWQTGKSYHSQILEQISASHPSTVILPFIDRMDLAYAVADIVVSRAGAIAISELCVLGKPAILIPSPNVAEDHQTKNARALEIRHAAILIHDNEAVEKLGKTIMDTLYDEARMQELKTNIAQLGIPDADEKIAKEVVSLVVGLIVETEIQGKGIKIPRSVYFLGIGGIGMSALARYFSSMGSKIAGYDRTRTPLTDQLIHEGMEFHFSEDTARIPKDTGLCIFTPAVPQEHLELVYLKKSGVEMKKRAEVLGMISRQYHVIAVAGTHGKTTTSSLIAHILYTANLNFLAFLGGISKNYGTNYLTNPAFMPGASTICVVEADEYDRSFLQLDPDIAIITSADADHLDIYGNHQALLQTFAQFTEKINKGGTLILKEGTSVVPVNKNQYSVFGYMVNGEAAFSARNIRLAEGLLNFDFHYPEGVIEHMVLNVPGMFNLENAIAALATGIKLGIGHEALRKAMLTYEGVKRRFEYIIRKPDLVYIDDYAHHPRELSASITAARDLYPGKKITGIFQPHLFSRTKDFAEEFALSLELLDQLILMEIYPAREKPMEGVTSRLILDKVKLKDKKIVRREDILREITICKPEVLLTLGAGDIDQLTGPISQMLNHSATT
jgi:UDP-N-acetylmuramate--alanine ligase